MTRIEQIKANIRQADIWLWNLLGKGKHEEFCNVFNYIEAEQDKLKRLREGAAL